MIKAGSTETGISWLTYYIEVGKFHLNFLNADISFNNPSIIIKLLQDDLETLLEGSMSQNVELGSRYVLCYVEYFLMIFSFFMLYRKNPTRTVEYFN